jgi:hypothetical protein
MFSLYKSYWLIGFLDFKLRIQTAKLAKFGLGVHLQSDLYFLNYFFKGLYLLHPSNKSKLMYKWKFGSHFFKKVINYLEKSIGIKNYLTKLRKRYRICQRKEHYYHKGIQRLLRSLV